MSDIIKKVNDQAPEAFFRNYIFLPADMAKTSDNSGSAIEAVLFLAFGGMAHNKFLLKINTSAVIKKYARIKLNILSVLSPSPLQRVWVRSQRVDLLFFTEQFRYF